MKADLNCYKFAALGYLDSRTSLCLELNGSSTYLDSDKESIFIYSSGDLIQQCYTMKFVETRYFGLRELATLTIASSLYEK